MSIVDVSFDVDFACDRTSRSPKAAVWKQAKRISSLRDGSTGDEIATYFLLGDWLESMATGHGAAVLHAVFPMREAPLIQITKLSHALDAGLPSARPIDLLFAIVGDRRDQRQLRSAVQRCRKFIRNATLLNEVREGFHVERLVRNVHPTTFQVTQEGSPPLQVIQ